MLSFGKPPPAAGSAADHAPDTWTIDFECCTCNQYDNAAVHTTGTAIAAVRRNNFEDAQDDYGVKNDRTIWVDARLSGWGDMSGPGLGTLLGAV